jgi:peroxiredoxin
MPGFELPDANGATVRSTDLQGKVVVMRFWATW